MRSDAKQRGEEREKRNGLAATGLQGEDESVIYTRAGCPIPCRSQCSVSQGKQK